MTWLVTWVVVSRFMISCPMPEQVCDDFGRCEYSNSTTLQICYDTQRVPHERYFDTKKEAEAFIDRGITTTYVSSFNPWETGDSLEDFVLTEMRSD